MKPLNMCFSDFGNVRAKPDSSVQKRGDRTGNTMRLLTLVLISRCITDIYNEDKSASSLLVSKIAPLLGISQLLRDRDSRNRRYNYGMKKTWAYKRKGIKGWWCGSSLCLQVFFLEFFPHPFPASNCDSFRLSEPVPKSHA